MRLVSEDRSQDRIIIFLEICFRVRETRLQYHCIEQAFLDSVLPVLSVILDPGVLFSFPVASEHVFVRMIIKSVLMLGRRTFGATTPQASLSRRFILRVALCRGWKQKRRLFVFCLFFFFFPGFSASRPFDIFADGNLLVLIDRDATQQRAKQHRVVPLFVSCSKRIFRGSDFNYRNG